MNEPSLFDYERARQERDAAIQRVDSNAADQWKENVDVVIRALAFTTDEFTTDDVWQLLADWQIEAPHEPRALGAAMTRAAKAGVIVATDRVRNSERAVCHAAPKRVWKSLTKGM
jgi:hypothetical protein